MAVGATVQAGAVLVVLAESADDAAEPAQADDLPLDHGVSRRCGSGIGSGSTRGGPR